MSGGYKTPARDDADAIKRHIESQSDAITILQRPTGSQLNQTVKQLQQLVNGLINQANISTTGNVNVGGAVIVPNNTLISTYARNHQVVTGYVSAWLDSSGNLLATASSARFKRDVETYVDRAWRTIRTVRYRLRAAWILADIRGEDLETVPYEIGVLAEELLEAGYPELVVLDGAGKPWSVHYERIAVIALQAVQQEADRNDAQDKEIAALRRENDEILRRLDTLEG